MRLWGFCNIWIYMCLFMVTEERNCPFSSKTVVRVDSCPMNRTAVERRKEIKNCEAIAKKQNCTESNKFLYHCVINEYGDALVEVCAPVYIMNGFCAEYNSIGERIQHHQRLKCSDVIPPCANRYTSTDAYLYKGCYDAVQYTIPSSIESRTSTIQQTSTFDYKATEDTQSSQLKTGLIVGIVFGFIICGIAVAVGVLHYKKRRRTNMNARINGEVEGISLLPRNNDEPLTKETYKRFHDDSMIKEFCERLHDKTTIDRGRTLQNLARSGDTHKDPDTKFADIIDKTKSYLEAYKNVNENFVETDLSKECKRKLEMLGLAVLIGQQGSGKTLSAVHILSEYDEQVWTKCKLTSWEELLAFDFKENTLIYIDNLFDGFIYRREVDKWWDSLSFFYHSRIRQQSDNVRLLITGKIDEMEEACALIKADKEALDETCVVREKDFPLTPAERIEMLEKQMKVFQKNTDSITDIMKNFIKETNEFPVGYPLCAHMYAIEERSWERVPEMFKSPRQYVKNHIEYEIDRDQKRQVKTLFLILVFYFSPVGSTPEQDLDLKYDDLKKFLKTKVSEELAEKMEPLSFDNLYDKARDLEGKVLIKHHSNMFDFKHQVYLEGVSEYFFRRYPLVAAECFPLDILRTAKLYEISPELVTKLIERLKKEIQRQAISEALSCEILKEDSFQERFCNTLRNETTLLDCLLALPDKTPGFHFPTIFWASKYNLTKLTKVLVEYANTEEEKSRQIYLSMLGYCCAMDKHFILTTTNPTEIEDLKRSVFEFRTPEDEAILHLLLSSNNSDKEIFPLFKRLLEDSYKANLRDDRRILYCLLQQKKCSRLLCLLEILNGLQVAPNVDDHSIKKLIDESPLKQRSTGTHLDLEILCRKSLIAAYGVQKENGGFNTGANIHDHGEFQPLKDEEKNDMADSIEQCLHKLKSNSSLVKITQIPIMRNVTPKLKTVIEKSIMILATLKQLED
uniref:Uncharacterized protein LOC111104721 isoform X2 n=1 Tax=Crassostrea virginica TaxID=6565 RepID=A0A8B8ATV5_CRAVI|nr:uncharacterized protein LOC111104721 isoform X2 [Crassostrea virginica]XP_022294526.1 uncharacterized protein LOC111104721 isoform X2 [Crassostrea virginica]